MKLRIMQNGHGKFFIQRKFLLWWVDETNPINELSDETILFNTIEDAERYAAHIKGFYSKSRIVKNDCEIMEGGGATNG